MQVTSYIGTLRGERWATARIVRVDGSEDPELHASVRIAPGEGDRAAKVRALVLLDGYLRRQVAHARVTAANIVEQLVWRRDGDVGRTHSRSLAFAS